MWIVSHRASVGMSTLTQQRVIVHADVWKTKAGKTVRWAPRDFSGRVTGHSETIPVQKSSWGKRSAAECRLRCEFFELPTPEPWRRKAGRAGAMRSRERPRHERDTG